MSADIVSGREKSFAPGGILKSSTTTHTGETSYICVVCNKRFANIGNLTTHKGTHAAENQSTCNKPCAKISSSEKLFQLEIVMQRQDLKMESELVANIYQDESPFLVKSFGCGLCGEMLEIEKEFEEHCFHHRYSPADDLFASLC